MRSTATPVRLQRSRAKGAKLVSPNGLPVVCVTRGTKWGNPFKVGDANPFMLSNEAGKIDHPPIQSRAEAFNLYAKCVLSPFPIPQHILRAWGDAGGYGVMLVCITGRVESVLSELRGKNLACWCKPGEPCHADVLLELANAPQQPAIRAGGTHV